MLEVLYRHVGERPSACSIDQLRSQVLRRVSYTVLLPGGCKFAKRYQCVAIEAQGCCTREAAMLLMSQEDRGVRTIQLYNQVELPVLGLGTVKARGPALKTIVPCALSCGIRHIDTASVYKVRHDSSTQSC